MKNLNTLRGAERYAAFIRDVDGFLYYIEHHTFSTKRRLAIYPVDILTDYDAFKFVCNHGITKQELKTLQKVIADHKGQEWWRFYTTRALDETTIFYRKIVLEVKPIEVLPLKTKVPQPNMGRAVCHHQSRVITLYKDEKSKLTSGQFLGYITALVMKYQINSAVVKGVAGNKFCVQLEFAEAHTKHKLRRIADLLIYGDQK